MKIHCESPGVWYATETEGGSRRVYVTRWVGQWFVDDVERGFDTLKEAFEYVRRVCLGD